MEPLFAAGDAESGPAQTDCHCFRRESQGHLIRLRLSRQQFVDMAQDTKEGKFPMKRKWFDSLGVRIVKFKRCIRHRDLTLRLRRFTDLPALYTLLTPNILLETTGVHQDLRVLGNLLDLAEDGFQRGVYH